MTGLCSRRCFLQRSLALAGLGLLSGCGMQFGPPEQSRRPARLGWLVQGSASWSVPYLAAFRQGLNELGYVEGRDVALEYRYADGGAELLPGLAAELLARGVDLVVTYGTPATLAARQASTTLPIVVVGAADPVGSGLVASLARPGGNVTGLSNIALGSGPKRLELLKEALPGASRVAFIWNSANPAQVAQWRELQPAAQQLGVALQSLEVRNAEELETAFGEMIRERPDAFLTTGEPFLVLHAGRIVDFSEQHRLPAMYSLREYVDAGGLMSYGPSLFALYRRAATYVDKILQGAKAPELPVEQPTTFEFVINLKTAQALGRSIPQEVLQQATEII
jgi:putative tryptophan/tyrosine transport system substrate-binding protein